ncbi:energy transducer TonB family protein [Archangium lansingense]|uniref:Energy transducer TonB n=1 Tax=Archangium lansingense TaxID=2995310 RepID=A0ABT4A8N5_9BACT|nr:energy transducer TonB [Archangium lansinium]MCY1078015.1 energy transducer TonB [Archangium lansinium]
MRHPSRVLKLALAFSLALHLVLLWWWQRIPLPPEQPPAPPPPTQSPVEVIIVDIPPARPSPPPASAPPSRSPETRERETGRGGGRTRPGSPAPSSPPASAPLASDVPRAEQGPENPSLLPSADSLALHPQGDFPVPPPEPGPPGTRLRAPAHPASPQELVAETARDTVARRRAESGLTHAYFGDMGKQLLSRFRQSHADVERAQTTDEKVAQKARDVSSVLSRAGEMEDPLDHPRRPDPLASGPASHPSMEEAQRNLAYTLPHKWTHSEGVAVVRLTQAADGKVLAVEILSPSGNRGLDQAAVAAVRDLEEELPSLPPEVLMGRDSVVSEWKFELLRTVGGPSAGGVGIVGTFDPVTGVEDALPSFAGRSQVRVTLVAYY